MTEQDLGDEIARVRHGQDVTASDLANRLMPWLAAHDAQLLRVAAEDVGGFVDIRRHGNRNLEYDAEAEASLWLEARAAQIAEGTSA